MRGTMWKLKKKNFFQGIIKRDEFVFETCKERDIPIVMLTSGGYLRRTAKVIADSIINLKNKGLIGIEPKTIDKVNKEKY